MDQLVAEVWPDDPPPQATIALRSYISRLRKILGATDARIETRPPGWLLQLPGEQVDALRFARLVKEARRHLDGPGSERSSSLLREALSLWFGEPLADLATLDFARSESLRLTELREEADELLLETRLATGDTAGTIDVARRLVSAQPFRERRWCALMLALYLDGQQTEAVATYGRLRQLLRDELGLDPSPRARELELRILQQDPNLQPPAQTVTAATTRVAALDEVQTDVVAPEVHLEGRSDTLARLDELRRRAASGFGGLVLIEANAGLGKTALLQVLVDRVRGAGGCVLEGNGVAGDAIPALWPWVTVVRQLLAHGPGDPHDTRGSSAPARLAVAVLGNGAEGEAAEDVPLAQTTLYRGVVDLLQDARRSGPLVVVFDDLQWIDRDSLTLLTLAVDQLASAGVLFAAAVRSEESNAAVIDQLVHTLRRDRVTKIELAPLHESDVALLAARLAGEPLDVSLVDALMDRTSGNPLFVIELVRLLMAEGQLTEQAARLALPAGVREVLQRRIDRLPRATAALLGVAALVGPNALDIDLLRDVTGTAEDDVLDACETALLSGLLVEGARPGTFALGHDLVRQTVTAALSEARRVRLHAKIAASLEERRSTAPEHVVEIARQLTAAAPAVGAAAAVPYLISASEDALSRYAHASAEATLESALALADTIVDLAQRRAVQMQVMGLLSGLRTLARAMPTVLTALSEGDAGPMLPRPTDPRSAAGWLGVVINVTTSGRWSWGMTAAAEVLAHAPSRSGEIVSRFVLGWLSYVLGDLEGASTQLAVLDEMIENGVEIALPGAMSRLPETVAGYGALIAHARGEEARASALLDVARQRARGSDGGLLDVALYSCLLAAMRGDTNAAATQAAESERLSRVVGYPVYALVTSVVWAWSRGLTGDPGQTIEQAYTAYAATGIRSHRVMFLLLRAEVSAVAGDRLRAAELVRESREVSAESGDVCSSPRLAAVASQLLEHEGQPAARA